MPPEGGAACSAWLGTAAPLPPGWTLERRTSAAEAAERAADALWNQWPLRPGRPWGLATGRTMEPVYAAIVRRWRRLSEREQRLRRASWRSFNLDEYVGLGAGDHRSFAATMMRQLAQPLGLVDGQLQIPDGLAADPDQQARDYAARLASAGGLRFQLLGLGLNGHVGFNEPPSGADEGCRCVRLSASTRRQNAGGFDGDPGAVPERAITLGMREILAAERVLLLVTGESKAAILQRLLRTEPSAELPASWLKAHPALTLIVDAAALPAAGGRAEAGS